MASTISRRRDVKSEILSNLSYNEWIPRSYLFKIMRLGRDWNSVQIVRKLQEDGIVEIEKRRPTIDEEKKYRLYDSRERLFIRKLIN
ncbi:hypothetical protein [Candidatus Methanoprimaticola sp. MG2]|uniref:hypothetical protein n=1 Tax=Candidatus Methanoprimaticola sp. MG2 TaxID=3228838 RepID=UPI0039C750EF